MFNDPLPENSAAATKKSSYPKPQANYQQVVQNPEIFSQNLQSFHSFFGTKFKVPILGGNDLDLHRLFVEVTSRGGIEKVVRDRRWKEVTGAFKFPSSITSASFVLRKYYLSLLYHFEQVYYFRKEEPSISVTEPSSRFDNGSAAPQGLEDEIPKLEAGSLVIGTIDAKFDYGYVVNVNLGTEKLQGVLYHTPGLPPPLQKSTNALSGKVRRRRKRRQLGQKDPFRPKTNRSGYNFFFAEHYTTLKPLYQGQEKAISKKIGDLWSRLSEAEKQVYQEKGLRDKERYRTEMLEYKASHHF